MPPWQEENECKKQPAFPGGLACNRARFGLELTIDGAAILHGYAALLGLSAQFYFATRQASTDGALGPLGQVGSRV